MAVAIDAKSTAQTDTSVNATSATHANLTVGASLSNGALAFIGIWDIKTVSAISMTWDNGGTNQAMSSLGTPVSTTGVNGLIALFGRINPTSGNKTLSCSWTTSSRVSLYGISWTGVDQTSVAVAFPHYNTATATSATASVTITSATGNAVLAAFVAQSAAFSSPTQTELFNDQVQLNFNAGAQRAAGAANVALQYSLASDIWAAAGVDILAASAGGGTKLRRNASLDGLGASGPFFSNPLARSVLGWRPSIVAVKRKLIIPPRNELRLAA